MLYSVLIVDDEPSVLKSMSNILDWEKMGLTVAGTCRNGQVAIEFIEKNTIHIVLTDIRMPVMDGIELTAWIKKNHPEIKTVLISGVQDFEMARSAIENSVSRYLLKPMRHSEFVGVLEQLRNELDKQQPMDNGVKMRGRKQFLFDLANGAIQGEDRIKAEFVKLGMSAEYAVIPCALAEFSIPNFRDYIAKVWNYGVDVLCTAIDNIFLEKQPGILACHPFNQQGETFSLFVFLHADMDGERAKICVQAALRSAEENFHDVLKTEIVCKNVRYFDNATTVFSCMQGITYGKEGKHLNTVSAKVMAYIAENYAKDITLETLSRDLFISPTYISRLFKEQTKENFSDYIIRVRVEKAKQLLCDTDMAVYEVAEAVGYRNIKYFYKVFKEYTGMSPTTYRNR